MKPAFGLLRVTTEPTSHMKAYSKYMEVHHRGSLSLPLHHNGLLKHKADSCPKGNICCTWIRPADAIGQHHEAWVGYSVLSGRTQWKRATWQGGYAKGNLQSIKKRQQLKQVRPNSLTVCVIWNISFSKNTSPILLWEPFYWLINKKHPLDKRHHAKHQIEECLNEQCWDLRPAKPSGARARNTQDTVAAPLLECGPHPPRKPWYDAAVLVAESLPE